MTLELVAGGAEIARMEHLRRGIKEVDAAPDDRPCANPDKPMTKLQVKLLDRTTIMDLDVNCDFTLGDVRTLLEIEHPVLRMHSYQLMDTGSFPPRKFSDFSATLEHLGLANSGVRLDCRPA